MAATGHLSWFVEKMFNAHRNDENEKQLWEMWLHKIWNKNWADFKREKMNKVQTFIKNEYIRKHPQETAKTVEKSRAIIEMFNKPIEQK